MLIRIGIPVDAVDIDGRTAMEIFLNSNDLEMVQPLSRKCDKWGGFGNNDQQIELKR
jgi:hypothetical protein